MPYYVIAWGSSILYGLVGFVGKLSTKYQVQNPWLFNFVWHLFILLLTIPIALANHAAIPTVWLPILIAAFFYAVGSVGYVLALQKLDISVMMPLFNLRTVINAILGALLLQEYYATNEYLLMLVAIIAGFFVSMDERFSLRSFFQRGIAILLLTITAMSFFNIFINKAVNVDGVWTATLWTQLLGQLIMVATIPLFRKEVFSLKKGHVGSLFAMALFGAIAMFGENQALANNVTVTSIIIAFPASMILAFLCSRFMPQLLEKHTFKVYAIRFAAAAVMIGATLKLTL